jgi:Ser/Thr protein kinase RdoA (MazF antagonist)
MSIVELQIAVERFDLGELVVPVASVSQAFSNEVFRVQTTTGTYALKLYASALPSNRRLQLAAGMSFERSVLKTGLVPMPRPVAAGEDWLIEVDTPSGPRPARCHEWVPGAPAVRPLRPEVIRVAGRHLGVLHAMECPGGDTSQLPPLDVDRWGAATRDSTQHKLGWADQLTSLTPLIEDLAADLEILRKQCRPMRISHRDYDPKNAVIAPAGQLVITDWDYAGPVLPDVELVVAATSFASNESDVMNFISGYRDSGGDATVSDPLAVTAELADLDWLLHNVEACVKGEPASTAAQYSTAADLIMSFRPGVAALRAWSERLASKYQ